VVKSRQVYTGILGSKGQYMAASGDPHIELPGVDLWTPQGDVTLIGAHILAGANPLPNSALGDLGGIYVYADISVVARRDEDRSMIVRVHMACDPIELPTVGEHGLTAPFYVERDVMFPEGCGIDLDRWHPVYLNMGYRAFFAAGDIEMIANGEVYYIER